MSLAAVVLLASSMLVLRSGDRLQIDAPPRIENGIAFFRVVSGTLYSIPAAEIDPDATRVANDSVANDDSGPRKLKVTPKERDRLLRQLEQNHSGTPSPQQMMRDEPPTATEAVEPARKADDEWSWRNRARAHEEAIRQATENLQLLQDRADRLEAEIRGFLSLGYTPKDFTYQSTMLQSVREQLPYAELEVRRAQRLYDQFREDARRQGIMPGWLR